MKLALALVMLPGLVIGLTVHEFAHAWSASLLGDDFARRQRRVSLNPFRHLAPLGTLAIFLLPFGWGKPVPVNLYNFRHPRRDYLLTSLAGPLANLLMIAVCLGLMQWTRHPYRYEGWGQLAVEMAHYLLMVTVIINMMLAVLNLIPLPPLDGSKIWPCIVPGMKLVSRRETTWLSLAVLMVLLWTNSLSPILDFAMTNVQRVMPVSDSEVFFHYQDSAVKAVNAEHWAEAERLFGEALAINPRSHYCLYGRAIARNQLRNWQGALEDVTEAIALHADPGYYSLRAQIFASLGQPDKAQADAALAEVLQPGP